jgi:hypothetical protein
MGNEDSGFGPSPRVGSAAPTARSEGKMDCPICNGTGLLPAKLHTLSMVRKRTLTCELWGAGYNQEQIARLVGWKSVDQVRNVLAHVKTPTERS